MTPHSSDVCKRYKHCGIAKAHHIFRTKNKNLGGVELRQEKAFLMSAGGEELSAFVESSGVKCFGDISNIDLQSISKMTNNSNLKTVSGD